MLICGLLRLREGDMKKAILIFIAIVAAFFIVANMDYLMEFVYTIQAGALIPIIVAIVFMLARHVVQAMSYDAAFEAVGKATGLWHNIVLIFSLVFINTFCLFSGATGVAFIIDDARRRGCDFGTATSGAVLSQIAYFAAVFVISVTGFIAMFLSGMLNPIFIAGGLLLAGTLFALASFFLFGYFKPNLLHKIFGVIDKIARRIMHVFKRDLPVDWGSGVADSFSRSAHILANNPKGAAITIVYASASAILNMLCLIAIGYAFGFSEIGPLVAAFALAAISVILSPTPQGVGVVEAAIAAVLTSAGCSLQVATAIALVYRGIMFWVPFCIGAVLLSQSGFFTAKKDNSRSAKMRDYGWIGGTLVLVVAVVNLVMALFPGLFAPYSLLTEWVDISNMLAGPLLTLTAIILIAVGVGLIFRYRIAWALALTLLSLIAGFEFVFYETIKVAIPVVLIGAWLFWKRDAFDVHTDIFAKNSHLETTLDVKRGKEAIHSVRKKDSEKSKDGKE